jgi:hypothetical protein
LHRLLKKLCEIRQLSCYLQQLLEAFDGYRPEGEYDNLRTKNNWEKPHFRWNTAFKHTWANPAFYVRLSEFESLPGDWLSCMCSWFYFLQFI